jgi:hypothetical protein
MNHKLARVVPIDTPHITTEDAAGLTGWVHDCGAFVFKLRRPDRCGVCWSALRNGQARNGQWRKAYIRDVAS